MPREMTAMLLSRVADAVDARYKNSTSLHIAAAHGFVDLAVLLLRYGAALDARGGDADGAPLHYAAALNHTAMVAVLVERAAQLRMLEHLSHCIKLFAFACLCVLAGVYTVAMWRG